MTLLVWLSKKGWTLKRIFKSIGDQWENYREEISLKKLNENKNKKLWNKAKSNLQLKRAKILMITVYLSSIWSSKK